MDDIEKMQYRNLRLNLNDKIVEPILGKGYYNEAMDVYKADEFTMRDLKSEYDELQRRNKFLCVFNIVLEIILIVFIIISIMQI